MYTFFNRGYFLLFLFFYGSFTKHGARFFFSMKIKSSDYHVGTLGDEDPTGRRMSSGAHTIAVLSGQM